MCEGCSVSDDECAFLSVSVRVCIGECECMWVCVGV